MKYFYNLIFDIKIMITKILDQDVISILEILDNNYYSIVNYLVYKDLDNNLIRECLYYITLYESTYEKNYRIYITN